MKREKKKKIAENEFKVPNLPIGYQYFVYDGAFILNALLQKDFFHFSKKKKI